MRTLATKQPSNQDFTHQKPVRKAPKPIVRERRATASSSLSTGLTGSAMLQRKPGCACGGGCPRCQEQALLQTKLKISEPGDKYEQEADRVADEVMRMPDSSVQRQVELEEEEDDELLQTKPLVQRQVTGDGGGNETPPIVHEVLRSPGGAAASQQSTENTSVLVQRMCDECAEEEKGTLRRKPIQDSRFKIQNSPTPLGISGLSGPVAARFHWPNQMARIQRQEMEYEEEETLQTKHTTSFTPDITPGIEVGIQSLKGSGQPLSLSERTFFEPRFGYDFSQVRVHTGSRADDAARAVQARAFTLGHNIVFGAGHYAPNMAEGRRLLAHELTHVVQQSVATPATKGPRIQISSRSAIGIQGKLVHQGGAGCGVCKSFTSVGDEVHRVVQNGSFPSTVHAERSLDWVGPPPGVLKGED